MKNLSMLAAAGLFVAAAAAPVLAQTTNSTTAGTATAPSGSQGAPGAAAPAGKVATTGRATKRKGNYKRFPSSSANTSTGTAPASVPK